MGGRARLVLKSCDPRVCPTTQTTRPPQFVVAVVLEVAVLVAVVVVTAVVVVDV